MKFLILITLLSSQALMAGVRGVGNGGGYGEMQAYFAQSRLPDFLQPCVADKNICALSASDLDWVQRSLPTIRANGNSGLFQVQTKCFDESARLTSGKVELSACALYSFSSSDQILEAKSFPSILAVVLASEMLWLDPHSAFETNLIRAQKLVQGLRPLEFAVAMTLSDAELLFHVLEITRVQGAEKPPIQVISVEGADATFNITSEIEKGLSCPAGSSLGAWSLSSPTALSNQDPYFFLEANLFWSCGLKNFKGKLSLQVKYEGHHLVGANIKPQVFQKQEL